MTEKKPPLSVEQALSAILSSVYAPVGVEHLALRDCFGRTLAQDVFAKRTQPPKNLSAMDGYALRAAEADKPLRVIGESSAGQGFDGALGLGEAVRIFTGAPVPDGADTVLIQEDARRDGELVTATAKIAPGKNIRLAGVDFFDGALLLRAGRILSAADVALAASADHASLKVARKPRLAVLSTGDELVAPGQARGPDQIVASNAFAILGLIQEAGGEAIDLGIAPDEPEAIAAAIARAKDDSADVLVTIGGASVGDRDFVRGALSDEGMALEFWKVNMKPGKPLIHGHIGPMRVIGLPGNPVSAAVCGLLFLRPLIRALSGDPDPTPKKLPARAGAALPKNGARREFSRATLSFDEDGRRVATPQADQDSSLNSVLAASDALIIRPENAESAPQGAPIEILLLPR